MHTYIHTNRYRYRCIQYTNVHMEIFVWRQMGDKAIQNDRISDFCKRYTLR